MPSARGENIFGRQRTTPSSRGLTRPLTGRPAGGPSGTAGRLSFPREGANGIGLSRRVHTAVGHAELNDAARFRRYNLWLGAREDGNCFGKSMRRRKYFPLSDWAFLVWQKFSSPFS